MVAERPKTGKAGKHRPFPTSKGEFEMIMDYTEERMDGPMEAVAAAMTQVMDFVLTLHVGDMIVVARQEDGLFVACQRNLFPEGEALAQACKEQKWDRDAEAVRKYVDRYYNGG